MLKLFNHIDNWYKIVFENYVFRQWSCQSSMEHTKELIDHFSHSILLQICPQPVIRWFKIRRWQCTRLYRSFINSLVIFHNICDRINFGFALLIDSKLVLMISWCSCFQNLDITNPWCYWLRTTKYQIRLWHAII